MNVAHIAKLANLQLLPGEEDKFGHQFEETISIVGLINTLDTSSVSATSQVTGLENVFRSDEIDVARIFPPPSKNQGYYITPTILDNA